MSDVRRGHKGRTIEQYAKEHPNLSCYEIASILGVSVSCVYNHVKPRGGTVRKTKELDVTEYVLNNPNLSISEVAKELGISYNTAKKYKNKVNGE